MTLLSNKSPRLTRRRPGVLHSPGDRVRENKASAIAHRSPSTSCILIVQRKFDYMHIHVRAHANTFFQPHTNTLTSTFTHANTFILSRAHRRVREQAMQAQIQI